MSRDAAIELLREARYWIGNTAGIAPQPSALNARIDQFLASPPAAVAVTDAKDVDAGMVDRGVQAFMACHKPLLADSIRAALEAALTTTPSTTKRVPTK
jgi:hypothetical protein